MSAISLLQADAGELATSLSRRTSRSRTGRMVSASFLMLHEQGKVKRSGDIIPVIQMVMGDNNASTSSRVSAMGSAVRPVDW